MRDRKGQRFANYQFIERLGVGSFGEVYLAEDAAQTRVAIKLLFKLAQGEGPPGFVRQEFIDEIARIFPLKHPNIVQLLNFGVEKYESIPFIVMQYAPKGTLRERHPRGTQVPLPIVVSYIKQAAAALQYIHDKGLIHRDIKPENLLVGEEGQILLSDFGITVPAHRTQSLITQELVAGSPAYMAPELFNARPQRASDQYALGIITYEWLCGRRPFQGNQFELVNLHCYATPLPLREYLPTLSEEVEEVVYRALAKEPHDRFASVQQFADALEKASISRPLEPGIVPAYGNVTPVLPPAPDLAGDTLLKDLSPSLPLQYGIAQRRTVLLLGMLGLAGFATLMSTWELFRLRCMLCPPPEPIPSLPSQGSVISIYRGHLERVNAIAWSPDGKRIASSSDDHTVQVWDATSGGHAFTYRGQATLVEAVAWSPDGKRIASAGFDHTIQVWNAADGSAPFVYRGHADVVDTVAWSPDSVQIASGSYDMTIQIWNVVGGNHVFTYRGHTNGVDAVAWSPNGKYIASGSFDKTVQVWEAASGHSSITYGGHNTLVEAVAWSPDSQRIASTGLDGTVQVWDATTGTLFLTYRGHIGAVLAVTWSPDGKRIASSGVDMTVQIWDASSGKHIFTYQQHKDEVRAIAWSPNSRTIASGSADKTVQVWSAG